MASSSRSPVRRRLVVFARWPAPAAVKTRLIPALGGAGAALVQHEMTTLLLARLGSARAGVEVEVRCAGASPERMSALYGRRWTYAAQGDGDLGRRLLRAADEASRWADRVVIVGSDCPDLGPGRVAEAFERLGNADVVIGPALDGGYYLIGMTRAHEELFDGIPWGGDSVLECTLERARASGLEVALLEPLGDVDVGADLERWERARAAAVREGVVFTALPPRAASG